MDIQPSATIKIDVRHRTRRYLEKILKKLPTGSRDWIVVVVELHHRGWQVEFGEKGAVALRQDLLRLYERSHSIGMDELDSFTISPPSS